MKEYLNTLRVMNLEKKLLFKSLRDQDRRHRAELEKQKPTWRLGELPSSGKTKTLSPINTDDTDRESSHKRGCRGLPL
jgi:hypothetical protein